MINKEYVKTNTLSNIPHIGMRNIKSAFAVIICFFIWQIARFVVPILELHPLYGYIAVILSMRDTIDNSIVYGWNRVKGTIIGLIVALICISMSVGIQTLLYSTYAKIGVELCIIVIGIVISLYVAHITKCGNVCAVACVVFLVCIILNNVDGRYIYAMLRATETIVGVGIALMVNKYVFPYKKSEESKDDKIISYG